VGQEVVTLIPLDALVDSEEKVADLCPAAFVPFDAEVPLFPPTASDELRPAVPQRIPPAED
jgi:hypothetical protein